MGDDVHDLRELLTRWESFYVIMGSAAATLTGLQFVVITMITELRRRASETQTATFSTPTVIHFTAALVVSGILSAPWPSLTGPVVSLVVSGAAGVGYAALVLRNALKQQVKRQGYRLVLEDWAWHIVLPAITSASQTIAALLLRRASTGALFVIAGATVLLLLIGIHNAWDTVTFVAAQPEQIGAPASEPGEAPAGESPSGNAAPKPGA